MYADASPLPSERSVPFRPYVTTLPGEDPSVFKLGAVPLNWEQFEQMFDSGVATVGAHTQSHPDLGFLSADIVAAEFSMSQTPRSRTASVSNRCTFNYPKDWWSVGAEPEVRTSYMRQPLLVRAHRTLGIDHYWLHRIAVQKGNGMRFLRRKLVTGLLLEDRLGARSEL